MSASEAASCGRANVKFSTYFGGGIDTSEQLDAALQGLRDECEKLIGEGKKVLVQ